MTDVPEAALRLAGFALAHAAWSIEDGETLCTLAFVERGGERELLRFEAASIPESLEGASGVLEEKLRDEGLAALIFDGHVTPEGGERTDALLLSLLGPGPTAIGTVVQRYAPARRGRIPVLSRGQPFRLSAGPEPEPELGANANRLLAEGIREHPHGARLWGAALD